MRSYILDYDNAYQKFVVKGSTEFHPTMNKYHYFNDFNSAYQYGKKQCKRQIRENGNSELRVTLTARSMMVKIHFPDIKPLQ